MRLGTRLGWGSPGMRLGTRLGWGSPGMRLGTRLGWGSPGMRLGTRLGWGSPGMRLGTRLGWGSPGMRLGTRLGWGSPGMRLGTRLGWGSLGMRLVWICDCCFHTVCEKTWRIKPGNYRTRLTSSVSPRVYSESGGWNEANAKSQHSNNYPGQSSFILPHKGEGGVWYIALQCTDT